MLCHCRYANHNRYHQQAENVIVILGLPTPDQKFLDLVFVQSGIWEKTANQRAGQLCEEDTCLVWCGGRGLPTCG